MEDQLRKPSQEWSLGATEHLKGNTMRKVIFACIHNAGGSQMAAAFFNQLADGRKLKLFSAGTPR